MIVHHRFQLQAKCPADGADDIYEVTVISDKMVAVEDIVAEAKRLGGVARWQEEITTLLARYFSVTVETVGTHMGGEVTTTCRVVA